MNPVSVTRNLILFLACIPACSAQQQSFTLQQAIDYGTKHSSTIAVKKMELLDAEAQIKEFKSIGYPKLNAGLGYNYFVDIPTSIIPNFISPAVYEVLFQERLLDRKDINTGAGVPVQFGTRNNFTAKIDLQTLIIDGSYFIGLTAQKMYKELSQLQLDQTESSVHYQIAKAYLAAVSAQESIDMLNKNIDNIENLYQQLAASQKVGFIESLDVERIQLSLQTLQTEKEKLDRMAAVLKNILKIQISYPLDKPILLSDKLDNLLNTSYAEIMDPSIQLDYNRRPEYKILKKALALTEINVRRLRSQYWPSLYGFASYQQMLQRNDIFNANDNPWFPATVVGVNMTIPIFDGLEKQTKITRAKLLRDKTLLQKTELERGISLEFHNAKIQFLNALSALESRKKNLALAEKIYNATQIKFKEGVGSSVEMTQAEREVYAAQSQLIEAQVQVIQAKLDLDKAIGKI